MLNNLDFTYVVIPSYRPPVDFPDFVLSLKSHGLKQILVIDDGSPMAYDAIFRKIEALGVSVLRCRENLGKGGALKLGFEHVLHNFKDARHVVCCDDDGQHHPEDAQRHTNRTSVYQDRPAPFSDRERSFWI